MWTAEQEREAGYAILAAEERALNALSGCKQAKEVISTRRTKRSESTRAATVDALGEAVQTLVSVARSEPDLAAAANAATAAWNEAQKLRWHLAMSAMDVTKREARRLGRNMMDESDLRQEGVLGLLRAAKRFDPTREIRFNTYARWWVRASMTRAIDKVGRTVRLPGGAVEQIRNIRKAMAELDKSGKQWTLADAASEAGVELERARFLMSRKQTVSLDAPAEDNDNARPISAFLEDDQAPQADENSILNQEITRMLSAFGQVLTDRERLVLNRRFGLEDKQPRSLSEIARDMKLSRERVRQIERGALVTLRNRGAIREVVAA